MTTSISIEQENILVRMMHWHLYCLSETLREHQINYSGKSEDLMDMIPFKIIRQAVELGNSTPICDWALQHFGFEFDQGRDNWVRLPHSLNVNNWVMYFTPKDFDEKDRFLYFFILTNMTDNKMITWKNTWLVSSLNFTDDQIEKTKLKLIESGKMKKLEGEVYELEFF